MKAKTVLAVVCLASLALATQSTPKLAWNPKVGATLEYAIQADSKDSTGMTVNFKADQVVKCTKVEGGKITQETRMKNIKIVVNGQDLGDLGDNGDQAVTTVFASNGELLEAGDDGNPRLIQTLVFLYPTEEAKLGLTWTREFKGKDAVPASKTTFTYAGLEDVSGTKCHKVKVEFKELSGDAPMSVKCTAWLATDTGDMVKWNGEYKNVVWQEGMPPADATMKVERKKSA